MQALGHATQVMTGKYIAWSLGLFCLPLRLC